MPVWTWNVRKLSLLASQCVLLINICKFEMLKALDESHYTVTLEW